MPPPWRPTAAHVRASAAGVLLSLSAVLLRRPDLLVLGAPLLGVAIFAARTRPTAVPEVRQRLDHAVLREGEATTWRVSIADTEASSGVARAEDVGAVLAAPDFAHLDPPLGAVTGGIPGAPSEPGGRVPGLELAVAVRSTRWGRRPIGPARVIVGSSFGAFRWVAPLADPTSLLTLPLPAVFDAAAPVSHPVGLVGLHRAARPGDGSEFAGIRAFQPGDRLRRIHWSRSLRSGELHVTATWADHDAHVVLLVDAFSDVGGSDGVDGRASSLDVTVRAAAAVAEHHLRRGDRVSLHAMGARGLLRVPAATGTAHLRRILDALATIEPGLLVRDDVRFRTRVPPEALVITLSPLVSPAALQRVVTTAARGITSVVIDTLPPDLSDEDPGDPMRGLAWRIRLLERARELERVSELGVPVVAWRGPGSLDQVLRDLHRRSRAPRVVQR